MANNSLSVVVYLVCAGNNLCKYVGGIYFMFCDLYEILRMVLDVRASTDGMWT